MFLDICSFSQRASEKKEDQEVLLRVMNLFFTEMIRIAEDYGGTVEMNTGDGLMAYFEDGGEHTAVGCQRAVAAALTMLYVNRNAISSILIREGIEPMQFRLGIDYGQVTVARLGAAKRFNSLVAIGTRANVACKMLAHASPGEMLVGEDVVHQLPAQWKNYCKLKVENTGWVRVESQRSYPFFVFDGRWIEPV
ncbi:MAG: adenylate/guanylate cyclase domain-containing protein [Verrucomicrobia bacterium]|nr:adenylate/guanylate cyclase domain-containing protein [Verrucomicrobiota bacterium]